MNDKHTRPSIPRIAWLLGVMVIIAGQWMPASAFAIDYNKLFKKMSKVADDVPLKGVDNVVEDARKIAKPAANGGGKAIKAGRIGEKAWKELLREAADPAILKQLDQLDAPTQRAIQDLARGANHIGTGIPDLAIRSRFLAEGGGETLAAVGKAPKLLDEAILFDLAIQGKKLPSPNGVRPLTLNDFGRFFHQDGARANQFWSKYVQPHWGKWLGGTALAAILLAPEEYLDKAGDLTHTGAKKLGLTLGDFIGEITSGAIEGAGEGTKAAVEKSAAGMFRTFFTSTSGIVSLVLLLMLAIVAVPITRGWLWLGISKLIGRRPTSSAKAKPESTKLPKETR